MQSNPVLSLSPSFNSYSSSTTRLADIAARVVQEFRARDDDGGGDLFLTDYEESLHVNNYEEENEEDKDDEEEFEFAVVSKDFVSYPAPADEIFYNGQIRPCYPLFNQDLLLEDGVEYEKKDLNLDNRKTSERVSTSPATNTQPRLSLRKLFIEDREPPSSCSSSEADEFDGVDPGSYCVWNPKTTAAAEASEEGRCKKSNSTGTSKRWRFRDLLYRSNSDGRDSFVFLTHPRHHSKNANSSKISEEKIIKKSEKSSAVAPEVQKSAGKIAAAPGAPYVKENNDERRRTSFLPYRQDLVGLFSNVNGSGRNLHPI